MPIMRINHSILTALLLCMTLCLSAQTSREEIYADLRKSGGLMLEYPGPQSVQTPAPKGYKPFYISHFGRHGSRWHFDKHCYTDPLETLKQAQEQGVITPLGEDLMRRLEIIWDDAKDRDGELTAKGYRQHQGIAERMYETFPEVFKGDARVTAISTDVPRVMVSMLAFTDRLKQLNPRIRLEENVSQRDRPYVSTHTKASLEYEQSDSVRRAFHEFFEAHIQPDRLVHSLFSSEEFISSFDGKSFMRHLYETASIIQDTELDFDIYDVFTKEELFDLFQISNYDYYTTKGSDPAGGRTLLETGKSLLKYTIDCADEAIAGGDLAASLRFSHDSHLCPLATVMQLDPCRGIETDPDKYYTVYANYKVSPMAGNLQVIFFRNRGGDVICKILLNENEVGIPVQTDMYPYYRWSDVRAYYMEQYDDFKDLGI